MRIALYFPLAMYQLDSDAVIAGLCAFRVMERHLPIFLPGGMRIGAASCYVTAAYLHLFGAGRVALALTGLTWGALYLGFMLLFLRALLGPKRACLAFLFAAFPSEQFMTVTYAPWGYGEIMASCAATLWLAMLWRRGGALAQRICFGVSVGLGLWCSIETLMIVVPAIAWIALARRSAMIAEAPAALAGAVAGVTPYLIGNVGLGFPSLAANWASRPVPSLALAWGNFVWLWTYLIPDMFFDGFVRRASSILPLVGYVAVAAGFGAALARRKSARDSEAPVLLALVLVACVLIFSFSTAGTIRGWTVRYIAPLFVVAPAFLSIGIEALARASRTLAVAAAAAVIVPSVWLYGLPGTPLRAQLTQELRSDEEFRRTLARNRVTLIFGNYLWVYHLNFDTRERVAGVPYNSSYDYYDYGGRLATAPVRWALLGGREEVSGWVQGAGVRGTYARDGDLVVFIANRPAPNAAALLAALRR